MKNYLNRFFFSFFLCLLVCSQVSAGITEKTLLDSLDLTDLNEQQQAIFKEEIAVYTATLDQLAQTDQAEWKKKLKEMVSKIKDGFRIYRLARNGEIDQMISDFAAATETKVYIFTYLQDAWLNNIFSRLSEAFYEKTRPLSYVIIKFKYAKGPSSTSERSTYFLKEDTIKMPESVRKSLDSKLSIANATASNREAGEEGLDLEAVKNVKFILGQLKGAGIKGVNVAGVTENMEVTPDTPPSDIKGAGEKASDVYFSSACKFFTFKAIVSELVFTDTHVHSFKYNGRKYETVLVVDAKGLKRPSDPLFLPFDYLKEQLSAGKTEGFSTQKGVNGKLYYIISDGKLYFQNTDFSIVKCNDALKGFTANKYISFPNSGDCDNFIAECQKSGDGKDSKSPNDLVAVNKTDQKVDLSSIQDLLNGYRKITDPNLGELQTSKVCLFLSDSDQDFTQTQIDTYTVPTGTKKIWLHFSNGSWVVKGGLNLSSLDGFIKNKMGDKTGFDIAALNLAIEGNGTYSLADLATVTYKLSDWLGKGVSKLYIPEEWWNCNSRVFNPPIFISVVKRILSPVASVMATSGSWMMDESYFANHGLSYSNHSFALQVGIWDGFVGVLAAVPTLMQLGSMSFTKDPKAVKLKNDFEEKVDQNGGGLGGFANMVVEQLKKDFDSETGCVLAHSIGGLGFDVLTIVFTGGTVTSAGKVGKVVASTFNIINKIDVVGTLVGKATTAVIKVTFRGTVKVVTFSIGKSGVKFLEATLNQTRYTLKLFNASAQAFQKVDWNPVRVVSMVGPNGKTINARVIINPLEQLKDVKYSIKKMLSDENGVALRDGDGEYAAVVSHKEGAEEIEELAVIKEGGDVQEAGSLLNVFKNKLVTRVQSTSGFILKHTDAEITQIINKGKSLNLTDDVIDDMLFISCRDAKPIVASELMTQMDNWANVVRKRGYPYKFNDIGQFNSFKNELKTGLNDINVTTSDVRIQGSSLRTPNANDVDLAAIISETDFDNFLVNRFSNKITKNGTIIDLSNKSKQQLIGIANECNLNPNLYNNQAKSFSKSILERKVSAYSNDKVIPGFKELYNSVKSNYPNLNIENITIQTSGGSFDLKPFIKL